MSRRDWLRYAAFALVGIAAVAVLSEAWLVALRLDDFIEKYDFNVPEGYSGPPKHPESWDDSLEGKDVQPKGYLAICNEPANKDHADLCQQWRTAEYTRQQAVLAAKQLQLGAYGNTALIFTLLISAVATFIASQAARDADVSSHRDLRAYMGHFGAKFESLNQPNDQLGAVKYFDGNYGKTPAKDVAMYIKVVVFDPKDELPAIDFRECEMVPLVQIVHPTQNFGSIVGPEKRKQTFLLYGYTEYTDVFEHRWRHRFAFKHFGDRPFGITEQWEAHTEYNDEEDLGPAPPPNKPPPIDYRHVEAPSTSGAPATDVARPA